MEQREYPRHSLILNAFLRVYNDSIHCLVENISSHGAYVKTFERDRDLLASIPVGENVEFLLVPENSETQTIKSKILRYNRTPGGIFVAIYFLTYFNIDLIS